MPAPVPQGWAFFSVLLSKHGTWKQLKMNILFKILKTCQSGKTICVNLANVHSQVCPTGYRWTFSCGDEEGKCRQERRWGGDPGGQHRDTAGGGESSIQSSTVMSSAVGGSD